MKRVTLAVLLCLLTNILSAQTDSAYRYNWQSPSFIDTLNAALQAAIIADPNDTDEGGLVNKISRHMFFMGKRVCNDISYGQDIFQPLNSAMKTYAESINTMCSGTGKYSGQWECIGPFQNTFNTHQYEAIGRINGIWVDPNDEDTILAGADAGGLWKSVNGGATWANITDASIMNGSSLGILGCMGVKYIAVNPLDHDNIYLLLKLESQYQKSFGYTLGLAYTTDGGVHWSADLDFNTLVGNSTPEVEKMAFMPGTQKLFAIYKEEVYYKATPSSSWTQILDGTAAPGWKTDIEFGKLDPDKLIISSLEAGGTPKLWVTDNDGSTWSSVNILPSGYSFPAHYGIKKVSLSSADVAYMFIRANHNTNGERYILARSPITTPSITILNPSMAGTTDDLEVSLSDNNVIYIQTNQGTALSMSDDEGAFLSFVSLQNGHPDGRGLFVYSTALTPANRGINDVVYYGSDGGICRKNSGEFQARSITGEGLAITQFYGFGGTEADENILTGGSQDNGGFVYIRNNTDVWQRTFGGNDGYTAKFRKNGDLTAYGEYNASGNHPMYSIEFSGNSFTTAGLTTPADLGISNINRPQYFDPVNNAHVGYSHIWTMPPPPATQDWLYRFHDNGTPPTGRDPIDILGVNPNVVSDFFISELNDNVAYIAYQFPAGDGNDPSVDDDYGKLWYTNQANSPNPAWSNITPPEVEYDCINSIMVDPTNSARIWIALGNINQANVAVSPSSMTDRILYSSNNGSTWQDVSTGLSSLPVTKLIYRQGSDDDLFAGTDVGVYRWNKSAQSWECFNNGMPPCIVMDMEFNYCAGLLRIATYGRGIWETNILVDPYPANTPPTYTDEFRPMPTEVISSNTAWTGDRYITTGIKVTSGNSLTIGDGGTTATTIHMPKNGVILVEPGAELIVDGATITNSCDDCMWYGIAVGGAKNQLQTTTYQGKVQLINDAILEHARIAVSNWNPDANNPYNTTGGIIQATGATFLNNGKSVEFLSYNGGGIYNDVSFFKDCLFTLDNEYKGVAMGYPMDHHVTLWDVHGIEFNGCTFQNDHTTTLRNKGDGIYAYNADFDVRPSLIGVTPPGNNFYRLRRGIAIEGDMKGSPSSIVIDQNTFDANTIGIEVVNVNNVSSLRNEFTIGNAPGTELLTCEDNIGIFTHNTRQLRIEENDFNGVISTPKIAENTIGVYARNTGENDKEIYKNTFDELDFAVYAIGKNKNKTANYPAGNTGLRVLCNSFTDNARDITSMGDKLKDEGIALYQVGNMASNTFKDAGNLFNTVTSNHIDNSASSIYYYYHTSTAATQPSIYVPLNTFVFPTANANECRSRLSSEADHPAELTVTERDDMKALYYSSKSSRDSLVTQVLSSIDFGNTNALIEELDPLSDMDAMGVMAGVAPFASYDVLKYLAESGKLDKTMMIQVLQANPEAAADQRLLHYLANDFHDPLDEVEQADALVQTGTITQRGTIEAKIAAHQANMAVAVNSILTDIQAKDELAEQDSIPVWLDRMEDLWAQYQKAYYYAAIDEMDIAASVLDAIPVNYTLDAVEQDEHEALTSIYLLLAELKDSSKTILDIDSTQRAMLTDIAETSLLKNSSSVAQSILNHVGPYPDPCITLVPAPMRRAPKNILPKRSKDLLSVYPNPAKDYVVFSYKLDESKDPVKVTVTNTLGQKMAEIELKDSFSGTYHLDVRHLPPGNYLYKANSQKKHYGSGKIVVVR